MCPLCESRTGGPHSEFGKTLRPGTWLEVTSSRGTPTSVVQWTGERANIVVSFNRFWGTSRTFTFMPGHVGYASTYHAGSSTKSACPDAKSERLEANCHALPVH